MGYNLPQKLEKRLNPKLDIYFEQNEIFVRFLKISKYIYMVIKNFCIKEKRQKYELILKDINYLIDKQLTEEKNVKNIVKLINQRLIDNNLDDLENICFEFLDALNFLIRSIKTCDRYLLCRSFEYQLIRMRKNLPYNIQFETVQSEKEVNDHNQKVLLKALNNRAK